MIDAREAFLPTDQGRSGDGFLIEACQSENRPLGSGAQTEQHHQEQPELQLRIRHVRRAEREGRRWEAA